MINTLQGDHQRTSFNSRFYKPGLQKWKANSGETRIYKNVTQTLLWETRLSRVLFQGSCTQEQSCLVDESL